MYKAILFSCLFVQVFSAVLKINPLNSVKYEKFEISTKEVSRESFGLDGITIIVEPSSVSNDVKTIANFSALSLIFENEQDDVPELKNLNYLIGASVRCFKCSRLKNTTLSTVRLYSLNLSGNNLSKIETGSFGENLVNLIINDNRLEEFSSEWFQNVSNLRYLNISRNLLSVLPEFEAINLNVIDFSYNQIKNISKGMITSPALKVILLNNNEIGRVGRNLFGGQVSVLDLSSNFINDTRLFSRAVNLTDLNMESNILRSLPVIKHCKKLKRLSLGGNYIKESRLDLFPNGIEEINLSKNFMTSIEGTFGENFVKIDVQRNNLKEMESLFINAVNLEELSVSENYIVDFPILKNCKKLRTIEFSFMGIEKLKKIHFKDIEVENVIFNNNHITWIEPNTFGPSVKFLDLHGNGFTELDHGVLNETYNLVELDLSFNSLYKFPNIKHCGKLEVLHLEGNLLEYLTAEMFENTSISIIDLSSNQISYIGEDTFGAKVNYLNLDYNKVTSYNFETLINLEELHLDHNNLTVVPHLNNCKKLKILHMPSNLITRLNNNTFNSIDLEDVNLERNHIVHIDEGSFGPTVKIINIAGNELINCTNSFRNLTNLKELQMQYNRLVSIPNLNDCINLQSLNVYNNKIKKLHKGLFDKTPLKNLNVAFNSISQVEDYPFGSDVREIDISNNQLGDVTNLISNATNLQNLKSSRNLIAFLPIFNNTKKLVDFNLRENNITRLRKGTFAATDLEMIDLESNAISEIESGTFGRSLKTLILTKNKIKTVSDNWFLNKTALELLELNDNRITDIPSYLFKNFTRLTKINLSHNKIRSIGKGAFDCGNDFNYLLLHHNDLYEIDPNIFSEGLIRFASLSLSENRISFLSGNFLNKIKPGIFHVFENPWQCVCWDEVVRWWSRFDSLIALEDVKTKEFNPSSRPVCVTTNFDYCIHRVDHKLIDVFEKNKLL